MGWWQADEKGLVFCHTGGVTGFDSVIAIIPSLKIGIVLCSNLSGDGLIYELLNDFVKHFINEKTFGCVNALRLMRPLSDAQLPLVKFVGEFSHPILENISVTIKENALHLMMGKNKTSAQLSPISLSSNHSSMTPELAQLAPHHCFRITWQSGMSASGEIYYDEDKIAFVEKEGAIAEIILHAECISKEPLRGERVKKLVLESKAEVGKSAASQSLESKAELPEDFFKPIENSIFSKEVSLTSVGFFAAGLTAGLAVYNRKALLRKFF